MSRESSETSDGFDCDACEPCRECPVVIGCSSCCCIAFFVLILFSLGAVTPLHYGVRYNSFSKSAYTDAVYEPGRYIIGPMNTFLLFPSSVQTIEFIDDWQIPPQGARFPALHTRTKEGLALNLQVSLTYRLIPELVGQLYKEFSTNYELVFVSSVRDTLIKAASEFEAPQFWTERAQVGHTMQVMVGMELKKTFAECYNLQLMVIDLPTNFEDRLVATQVQRQAVVIREREQVQAAIRSHTNVIKANYDRISKVLLAEAKANFTLVTQRAQAEAQQKVIDAEAEAMALMKNRLQLDTTGLVQYQRYFAIADLGDSSVYYGFADDASTFFTR